MQIDKSIFNLSEYCVDMLCWIINDTHNGLLEDLKVSSYIYFLNGKKRVREKKNKALHKKICSLGKLDITIINRIKSGIDLLI